jgi:hypothetical protein
MFTLRFTDNQTQRCGWFALATAMIFLSGCVVFESPLSTAKDSQPDLALVGTWEITTGEDEKPQRFVVVRSEEQENVLLARAVQPADPETDKTLELYCTKLDDHRLVSLVETSRSQPEGEPRRYTILKYNLTEDRVETWRFNHEFLKKAVTEGKLKGTPTSSGRIKLNIVLIEESSETLRKFLSDHAEESFVSNGDEVDIRRVENEIKK